MASMFVKLVIKNDVDISDAIKSLIILIIVQKMSRGRQACDTNIAEHFKTDAITTTWQLTKPAGSMQVIMWLTRYKMCINSRITNMVSS